jgi:hypothetical protein
MKKVRKKYVAHVNKAKTAKAVLRNLAIGFIANGDGLVLMNIKKNRIEHAGSAINAALEKIRYKWVIYIAAMGRTEPGQEYIKSEEIHVPHEVFKHEISSTVGKIHEKLTLTIPAKHLSNVGWIALPVYSYLDEKELAELFETLNCWDGLSGWQQAETESNCAEEQAA